MTKIENDWVYFKIDDNYRILLWIVLLIVLHYFGNVLLGGSGRKERFPQQWMDDNFGKDHKEATGLDIKGGGYPDCGSGRYTMEAGYEKWFQFMNNQRAHGNYMEAV